MITDKDGKEQVEVFTINGEYYIGGYFKNNDLMLKSIKREGWINLYKAKFDDIIESVVNCIPSSFVYKDKEVAFNNIHDKANYINTVKVEWEE